MRKLPPISVMHKFRLGTKIVCADGEEASLTAIGLDGTNKCLLAIAVHIGHLFGKTVYVSFAHIVEAISSRIMLDLTYEQLLEARREASNAVWLDSSSVVVNTATSTRGTLLLAAVHPESGQLAFIVAHHLRPRQDTLLRADRVTNITRDQITVTLPEAVLQTLPPYRTDEDLQADVEKTLFALTPLHVDLDGITMHVVDGVLYLDGNVSSSLRGKIVADQAVGVQGLVEVKNRLVGDDVLASDVAMALGHDPHTHDLPIGVYPRLGIVRLRGTVHNVQQKIAAEAIAKSIPGVRGVDNDLVMRPDNELLHAMAPTSSGESEDLVPGKYVRHTK